MYANSEIASFCDMYYMIEFKLYKFVKQDLLDSI